jgi:TrpR-related protein YerC/YecD
MAKHKTKLSRQEVEKIFYRFCLAISELPNIQEVASFLRDLLSYQEAEMIAKRLRIAELLLDGDKYEEIMEKIKVSAGTIARVQEWLKMSGSGYRKAVEQVKKKYKDDIGKSKNFGNWSSIKKRYPIYYWPEILLEDIIKSANKKQKDKFKRVVHEMENMKDKRELYLGLKKLIKY